MIVSIHWLSGPVTGIRAYYKDGTEIVCPIFEISDGKVLPRKIPRDFVPGVPITLGDIKTQAENAMRASIDYCPNEQHYCNVFLFEKNRYSMGVLVTNHPVERSEQI